MEDFQAAFLQRIRDVEVLDKTGRRTAAMHFGGVAVECLLKYMILCSLPRSAKWEWKTETNDPGHTISRPGHDYQDSLNHHNRLKSRVQQFPSVQAWLNNVEYPDGHFIDMRYLGYEAADEKYKKWWDSYQSLIRWLQVQSTKLGR